MQTREDRLRQEAARLTKEAEKCDKTIFQLVLLWLVEEVVAIGMTTLLFVGITKLAGNIVIQPTGIVTWAIVVIAATIGLVIAVSALAFLLALAVAIYGIARQEITASITEKRRLRRQIAELEEAIERDYG